MTSPSSSSSTSLSPVPVFPLSSPEINLTEFISQLSVDLSGSYRINKGMNLDSPINRLVVEILTELQTALQNGKNHCKRVLEAPLSSLQEKPKTLFTTLEELYKGLQEEGVNLSRLDKIWEGIRRINDGLSQIFPDAHPLESRFIRLSRQYEAIGPKTTQIKVKLLGVFFFPSRVTLDIDGKKFSPLQTEVSTNLLQSMQIAAPPKCRELDFNIPVDSLYLEEVRTSFTYIDAQLIAPWWESGAVTWGNQHDDTYNVRLGILPSTVGKIMVQFLAIASGQLNRARKSEGLLIELSSQQPEQTLGFNASPGWRYKDANIVIQNQPGKIKFKVMIDPKDKNSCHLTIALDGEARQSSRVDFHLVWTEYLEVRENETRMGIVKDLYWGTSKKIIPDRLERIASIDFVAFNGQRFALPPTTDASNPFVKLYADQGNLLIEARDPHDKEIDFPAIIPDGDRTATIVANALAMISAPYVHQTHDLNQRLNDLEGRRFEEHELNVPQTLEQSMQEVTSRRMKVGAELSRKLQEFKTMVSKQVDGILEKQKEAVKEAESEEEKSK
jgi:hypothetical protein